MVEKNYSIGEIAKLLGVSSQTIRRYEEAGLLQTDRHDNNYRTYKSPDFTLLMIARRYRSMGLSVRQILEMLTEEKTMDGKSRLLDGHIDSLYDQIEHLNLLVECARQQKQNLEDIATALNKFEILTRPDMAGIIYRDNREIREDFLKTDHMQRLLKHMPMLQYMCAMKWDDLENGRPDYYVGFCVAKKFAERQLPEDGFFDLPSCKCLSFVARTVVEKVGDEWLHQSIPRQFAEAGVFDYISSNGLKVTGDVIQCKLFDTRTDIDFIHYMRVWIPVE